MTTTQEGSLLSPPLALTFPRILPLTYACTMFIPSQVLPAIQKQLLERFQVCLPPCWSPKNTPSWLSGNFLVSLWAQVRVDNSLQVESLVHGPASPATSDTQAQRVMTEQGLSHSGGWGSGPLGVSSKSAHGSQGSWEELPFQKALAAQRCLWI